MFRTPLPGGRTDRFEQLKPDQILAIFASCLQGNFRRDLHNDFAEAWGNLFSTLYISADDPVSGMQGGEHPLGEAGEHMFREFIRMDCEAGVFLSST
jgi:hypothetical protein